MNRTSNPITMVPTTAFSSKRSNDCCTLTHVNDQDEYGGGDHALTFDNTTINRSKTDLSVQAHSTLAMTNHQFSMQRTDSSTNFKGSCSHTTIN